MLREGVCLGGAGHFILLPLGPVVIPAVFHIFFSFPFSGGYFFSPHALISSSHISHLACAQKDMGKPSFASFLYALMMAFTIVKNGHAFGLSVAMFFPFVGSVQVWAERVDDASLVSSDPADEPIHVVSPVP